MIAQVRLEAFYTSIEQQDNPSLRKQPVCVVNGGPAAIVVTASHEARMLGVQAGMSWEAALELCPTCIRVTPRPTRYIEISTQIMEALREITPEVEVSGVDEAFLDLTSCQSYYRYQPEAVGHLIQQTVSKAASGIFCSVGISGDKATARWVARQSGPGELTLLPPAQAEERLRDVPLSDLCGIGPEVTAFFAQHNVHFCGDMKKIPMSVPAQRYGNVGRRWWLMAQARDPSHVDAGRKPAITLGQGKILSPQTGEIAVIQGHFMRMAERLATDLRRRGLLIPEFHIAIRCTEGWRQAWLRPPQATCDSLEIFRLSKRFLRQHWFGDNVQQIRIQASSPVSKACQPDFFA